MRFRTVLGAISSLTVACSAQQESNPNTQRDLLWLAELERESPCASVKIPYEIATGVSDKRHACILTAAALRAIVDSMAISNGIAPHVAAGVLRAEVTGGVVAPLRAGDPDWSWWIVYFQSSAIDATLEVRFDRVTREISAGVCSECRPRAP